MKKQIAISLSPNTDAQDVRTAIRALANPPSWKHQKYVEDVESRLSMLLPGRHIVAVSSGRQALYDILRAFGIGSGDEVILQAFTCIAVPESIIWTGAKPVYADIDSQTYGVTLASVAAKVTPTTRAIIVQHTFGIPAPVEEIVDFAHERGIIVIEDCAHALGSTIGGKAVGTLADAAVISFGRDKMISSVFGGAAVFADKTVADKAKGFAAERPYPPMAWVIQQLLHPIMFAAIVPTYFTGFGKFLLVLAQRIRLLSRAVEKTERTGQMPPHIAWRYSPALAQILIRQLTALPTLLARRRAIAARYRAALANTSAQLARVPDGASPSWLRFPMQIENPKKMLHAARQHSMMLGDWYDAPLVPADASVSVFHYTPGSCPVAEDIALHVINLPTYPGLSDEQVERVIAFCMEFYGH